MMSYLRGSGRVVLDSLAKVDAVVRLGARVDAHLATPGVTDLALGATDRPERVTVNDRAVSFEYAAPERLVRIPPGQF